MTGHTGRSLTRRSVPSPRFLQHLLSWWGFWLLISMATQPKRKHGRTRFCVRSFLALPTRHMLASKNCGSQLPVRMNIHVKVVADLPMVHDS